MQESIVLAAERYNQREPVNLGSAFEISIKDLVATIARLTEFKGELLWDASKPNGQPRRKLDTTRAKEMFGFESTTQFEDGLRRTIDWYTSKSMPLGDVRRANIEGIRSRVRCCRSAA